MSAANNNYDFEVPVLIVGGGACGLTTSLLLSDLGVAHLLVERHASTSILPKAHYLNQRTMKKIAFTPYIPYVIAIINFTSAKISANDYKYFLWGAATK